MSDKESRASQDETLLKEIIELSFPIKVNGIMTDRLAMRRMLTKDQRVAMRLSKGDEAEFEIILFSRLTDCAINDLEELDFADYRKLQKAFLRISADHGDTENPKS